ncbi:FAD-dependent oxidoreductase [Geodermatophilus maliterrae]|uniref:FAD-dependent oxidoreductase n=1 Tax=Geodermatophilus maliterrae TaxID=3162531 RepID=A0ABV3XD75_9ACTN
MRTAATVPSGETIGSGRRHAVVVGGSMAGLVAARVLAAHFDRVTIVERDRLRDGGAHRKGVPQGRQLHALLARGRDVLEALFPGFGRELEAAGAVPISVPGDFLTLTKAGWLDRRAPGWTALSASRPLIEATVRRRLLDLPGITLLDGHEATALVASRDGRVVRGVTVRRVGGLDGVFSVDADLVVDASGRGSRTPAWLAELGYPAPEATRVDPDIAYATRTYRIPDGFTADWKAVMLMSQPPTMPRTGFLFPIEDGQWMVALMGAAGQHPPTDEEGHAAFVRSLRSPVIAEAVADAEPVSEIRGHRGTTNRQWHFERMRRWPERFVVLGDAVCAFNPIYGQGMTTAAVGAETLDACLRSRRRPAGDLDGLGARFQRALARRNADAWMFSTGEDLRFPTTTGMTAGRVLRAQHHYLDRIEAASTRDPAVADVYVRAFGMLERPTALFRPGLVAAAARTRPTRVTGIAPVPPRRADQAASGRRGERQPA